MPVDRDLMDAVLRRNAQMDQDFHRWRPYLEKLRDWIAPQAGQFFEGEDRSSPSNLMKIIDSKGRKSLRTLTSGLMAGMTSPSRPWFKLGLVDTDRERDQESAEWLHEAESRMYDILRRSNIYRTLEHAYRDLGVFGTFGGVIVPSFEEVVHGHAFPMGRFSVAEDEMGRIGYLHRDCRMTTTQLVQTFGLENVSDTVRREYEKGDYHNYHQCRHAIERRHNGKPATPAARDMGMASLYWEKSQEGSGKFLEVGGFSVANILAPRWEATAGEAWATNSPGMDALGDIVQLQGQHKDKALAIQKMHNPPLQSGQSAAGVFYRNLPGGVTTMAANDLGKQGLRPIHEVRPDVQWLVHDINETRQRISEAFFEDLFLMTSQSDRRQITAREIAERHEEKLLVLGPVLESLDHALLSPLIEATFHFASEADLFPPAPEGLQGQEIRVEYISALAQAQRAVGVAPIERTIGFIATLEQIQPGAVDNLDGDKAIRDFVEQIGPPPDMIRDPDDVQQRREARAQQAQQQQLMENAQPLANAASLISEASERGQQQGPAAL